MTQVHHAIYHTGKRLYALGIGGSAVWQDDADKIHITVETSFDLLCLSEAHQRGVHCFLFRPTEVNDELFAFFWRSSWYLKNRTII